MDIMTIAAIVAMVLSQLADILTTERFLRRGYRVIDPRADS